MNNDRKTRLEAELAAAERDRLEALEAIERETEARTRRAVRELEKLAALPEFGELVNGTVLGLAVTLGRSEPYAFIAYRTRDLWYLTGKNSPNGVSSDGLADWLTTGGRRLELAAPLAEFELSSVEVSSVSAIDLGSLLEGIRGDADPFLRATRAGYEG